MPEIPADVLIEPARAGEATDFIALRGRTRENAVSAQRLASLGITADSWAAQVRSGVLVGFVARQGGALLGYGFGDTRTGEVVVLALLPQAEGRGIGRQLLALVVDALRQCGHTRLFLGCAADPAVRSYGFYRRLGWRPTGTIDRLGDEVLELGGAMAAPGSIAADAFVRDVSANRHNAAILARWPELALPDGWLVAGCLFQTIWNLQGGRDPASGIQDYDLFYFDGADLSDAGEQAVQARAEAVLDDLGITVEAVNQARVHLWYPQRFARPYPPLRSCEDGIRRFLVRETCVGVRPGQVHAPYGVAGIYAGTLSPNPLTPYPELFAAKVASYVERWPNLRPVREESGS